MASAGSSRIRKVIKRAVITILALLVLAVSGTLVRFYVMAPEARAAEDLSAPTDEATVERGEYLANHVLLCTGCHSKVDEETPGEPVVPGHLGEGREFPMTPDFPGSIRAPNITSDKAHGLGEWTDGEIVRALREGISRDGSPLFPVMPYTTYREILSKRDALAVVAYLRTLEPIANDPGSTEIAFPVSMFVRTAPRPVEEEPPPPPEDDSIERGRWLLRAAGCGDCHNTVDDKHQPIEGMAYAGGIRFPMPDGTILRAPNITSDPPTGIGAYSDEAIRRALFEGKGQDGRDLYIMPWTYYAGMTDDDKTALVKAVKEIPPVSHAVARIAK